MSKSKYDVEREWNSLRSLLLLRDQYEHSMRLVRAHGNLPTLAAEVEMLWSKVEVLIDDAMDDMDAAVIDFVSGKEQDEA